MANSFQGSLRGQPVKVLSARANTVAPRIVVLLDLSGSVNRSNHRLDDAQFVAKDFLAVSPATKIALVMFSDHIIDTIGFDGGSGAIARRLAALRDGQGRTALFDSLMYAADFFDVPEYGDAVYLVSDGADNRSKFHEKDVVRKFLSRGVRLFWFPLLGRDVLKTEEERAGYSDIEELTALTGGSIVNAPHQLVYEPSRLHVSPQVAYDLMKSFYVLEIELPAKLEAEHHWELHIVDKQGKMEKGVEIIYPRDLVPCPASSSSK